MVLSWKDDRGDRGTGCARREFVLASFSLCCERACHADLSGIPSRPAVNLEGPRSRGARCSVSNSVHSLVIEKKKRPMALCAGL